LVAERLLNKIYKYCSVEISASQEVVLNPLNLCVPTINKWKSVGFTFNPGQQTFLIFPNILVKLTGFPFPIYAFFQTNFYRKVPKYFSVV